MPQRSRLRHRRYGSKVEKCNAGFDFEEPSQENPPVSLSHPPQLAFSPGGSGRPSEGRVFALGTSACRHHLPFSSFFRGPRFQDQAKPLAALVCSTFLLQGFGFIMWLQANCSLKGQPLLLDSASESLPNPQLWPLPSDRLPLQGPVLSITSSTNKVFDAISHAITSGGFPVDPNGVYVVIGHQGVSQVGCSTS